MIETTRTFLTRLPRHMLALAALVVLAYLAGAAAYRRGADTAFFYQTEYTAAVSLACGKGWLAVYGENKGVIASFLSGATKSLDCDAAYSSENAPRLVRPALFHHQIVASQYLFAGLWRLGGISWSAAAIVGGLLLALTAIAIYLLARQLLGDWPSLLISAGLTLLPWPFYEWIPHLRDFSKAPFLILLSALTLWVMFCERNHIVPLAAASGLVAAIGTGFRSDVSLFLVLFPIALMIRAFDRKSTTPVLVGLLAFAVGAVLINAMMNFSPGLGHNNAHFMILGQSAQFIEALGFGKLYQGMMTHYSDGAAWQLVTFFSHSGGHPDPGYGIATYDRAGMAYLIAYAKVFPANLILSALTAAYKSMLSFAGQTSVAQAAALLLIVVAVPAFYGARGFAAVVLAVLLAGMTSIQFSPRHYFYVEVYGVVFLAAVAIAALATLLQVFAGSRFAPVIAGARTALSPYVSMPNGRIAMAMLALIAAALVVLLAARPYQAHQIERQLALARSMPAEPIARASTAPGEVVFRGDAITRSSYIHITLEPAENCRHMPKIEVAAEASDPSIDWSFHLSRPHGAVHDVYFPALKSDGNAIKAIKVADLEPGCEPRADLVKPTAELLPVILYDSAAAVSPYYRSDVSLPLATSYYYRFVRWWGPKVCLAEGRVVRGGEPAVGISREITVPRYIALDAGDARDGYYSDHLDVGDPELIVAGRHWRLGSFPVVSELSDMLPMRLDANIAGKPLDIGGVTFAHGIGLHANAHVYFETPPEIRGARATFQARYGIDAQTGRAGSVSVDLCLVR